MRTLGIDYGRARIGLALADDVLRTARPLKVVKRSNATRDIAAIQAVIEAYEVTDIVLGLPLNMNGSEGPSAAAARRFGDALKAATALVIHYCDERLSTFEAQGQLRDQGFSAREQRDKIDAQAAAVILQSWIDSRTPNPEDPS